MLLSAKLSTNPNYFGYNDFFISFDDHDYRTGNCIVLQYDLQKKNRFSFSKRGRKTGQAYDSLVTDGKIMYHYKTAQGKFAGEILLYDNMSVGYYPLTRKWKSNSELEFYVAALSDH